MSLWSWPVLIILIQLDQDSPRSPLKFQTHSTKAICSVDIPTPACLHLKQDSLHTKWITLWDDGFVHSDNGTPKGLLEAFPEVLDNVYTWELPFIFCLPETKYFIHRQVGESCLLVSWWNNFVVTQTVRGSSVMEEYVLPMTASRLFVKSEDFPFFFLLRFRAGHCFVSQEK